MYMNGMDDALLSRRKKGGGGFLPSLCNILGVLILMAVLALCLALTLPRFLGYGIYNVVSGSMEPEIPVGSVVYVEGVRAEDVAGGDVIAFQSGDSVIIHRVVENQVVEGKFTTKGDANAEEDMEKADYSALIGRVSRHYPFFGRFLEIYTSSVGKIYVICFAACGAMFNILAGRMRERRREG